MLFFVVSGFIRRNSRASAGWNMLCWLASHGWSTGHGCLWRNQKVKYVLFVIINTLMSLFIWWPVYVSTSQKQHYPDLGLLAEEKQSMFTIILQNPAKYFCLTDTLYKRRLHKIPQRKQKRRYWQRCKLKVLDIKSRLWQKRKYCVVKSPLLCTYILCFKETRTLQLGFF